MEEDSSIRPISSRVRGGRAGLRINLEISSDCNLNCVYCPRRNASGLGEFMELSTAERVLRSLEPERVVLIGLGEPLLNPRYEDILRILRGIGSEVVIQTNGTFPGRLRRALEIVPDAEIDISLDLPPSIAHRFRQGLDWEKIVESAALGKVGARVRTSALLLKDGIRHLPELLAFASDNDMEGISLSGMVPINEFLDSQRVFTYMPRSLYEYVRGREAIMETVYQATLVAMDSWGPVDSTVLRRYEAITAEMEELGIPIVFALYDLEREKAEMAEEVEKKLKSLRKMAREMGLAFESTSLFPREKRICPYAESGTAGVGVRGELSPCYDLMHDHEYFLFGHRKKIRKVSFGPAWDRRSLERYEEYRSKLLDFEKNFAPCNRCPFAVKGACYFVEDNSVDCEGASPSCSECPFALDLVSCSL